ncbi:putative protein kinase RLK-Pelle-DLSV family [Rosa chinensis]|uniref:non-specific serine/threonine protein kinase n=1 Tax=Rosa chinensis TaxID=74649 RepID=A0A2P6PD71_ROSCH|nr:putative protein kinase RLK-Pelle-DLSV family [Rosa chinensis]
MSNCSSAVLLDNGNFIVKDGMGADLWLLAQNIWTNGSTPHWRSGPWYKSRFIGIPTSNSQYLNPWTLVDNVPQGTRYLSYSFDKIPGDKVLAYADISSEGILRFLFSESGKNCYLEWKSWNNPCDNYGACRPFGVCKASESPICKCLKGFIPKSNEEWSKRNRTRGCVRRTNLSCKTNTNESVSSKGKDEFLKLERLKLPNFHEYLGSVAMDKFEDCKTRCLSNCSCLAYAYVDNFLAFGEDLYVRLAHSELGNFELTTQRLESTSMIKIHRDGLREYIEKHDFSELKIYDFDSILIATDYFSITNKLRQRGFGPVYKGMLPEGKETAVKRLSSSSGPGVEEFKNEMLLISNLQHKNLVRMMGCCVKEDEKLLIYEFMPNKSLDTFLFDYRASLMLTIVKYFCGFARGLLYLHHDSYVRVIHRDLKVSNILLDEKMNPKISDFGLARIVFFFFF